MTQNCMAWIMSVILNWLQIRPRNLKRRSWNCINHTGEHVSRCSALILAMDLNPWLVTVSLFTIGRVTLSSFPFIVLGKSFKPSDWFSYQVNGIFFYLFLVLSPSLLKKNSVSRLIDFVLVIRVMGIVG